MLVCCSKNDLTPRTQCLRLNLYSEPPSLDSRKATDATSMNLLVMLFEGLTRIALDNKPHPAAAEEITISKDLCTYTFKLRPLHWSNGDLVTAHDFLYAWQKILDPLFPAPFANKLYIIKNALEIKNGQLPLKALGVKILDATTLEVQLKNPASYFLELLAFPTFFPIHPENDQKYPDWVENAGPQFISNGPFLLRTWEHDNEIIVEKNPFYWDSRSVILDEIHLSMIDDVTTEYHMFEMNEIDWAGSPLSTLPLEVISSLKDEESLHSYPVSAVYYYKINTDHYPLGNRNIRRALALAIDRKTIVEHITPGKQIPALALVPSIVFHDSFSIPRQNPPASLFEDCAIEEAKKCFTQGLEELGIDQETFPKLILSYNMSRDHQTIASVIQQQWKSVLSIDVDLESCDWKLYLSKINKQDYQIGRMGWVGDYNDPLSFLLPFKYKDRPPMGGNNETGWENPQFISLLDHAESEVDPKKRAALLEEAEALLIDEMPIIPLFFLNYCYLKKKTVHGVYLSALGIADYKNAYIKE